MGQRGPAKQPTELKLLKGETRAERLNTSKPKPAGGILTRPPGMDDRAKRVWDRQVRAMRLTGVLTTVDQDALRAYCEAVSRYETAAKLLASSGPLVRGQKGELVKNPLHQVARDNAMLIRLLGRELGFMPSSREGIRVQDDDTSSAFSAWEAGA